MFRLVNGWWLAPGFYDMRRRTDIWFAPVMALMFVAFLALTPLAIERRSSETLYILSILLSSLFLALAFSSALFYLIDRSTRGSDNDTCLGEILKSLRRALSRRNRCRPETAIPIEPVKTGEESFLLAPDSGYLQRVDFCRLSEAARHVRAVICFLCCPGDFVLKGSPLAAVYFADQQLVPGQAFENLQHRFARAVSVERKRSIKYDPEYAIVRITEIAALWMSPSFADPVKTLACINASTVGLREILRAPAKSRVHYDSMGQLRILEKEILRERVLSSAFDALRPIVKNSVGLSVYLLQAISALAPFLNTSAQALELKVHAELIHDGVYVDASLRDRLTIDDAYLSARRSLSCPTHVVKLSPRTPGSSQTHPTQALEGLEGSSELRVRV